MTTQAANSCTHLAQVQTLAPSANGCEACLKRGGWPVRLRAFLTDAPTEAGDA